MKIEKYHNGIRFTLTNDDLQEGDMVYPIASGRCLEDGSWILHEFDFRDFMCGFPNEPHQIINLHHSDYKSHEIRSNHGYGPKETYYKIIKAEKQIRTRVHPDSKLVLYNSQWVEIDINEAITTYIETD
jgi:hypothetical protein